ncbi:MAG: 4-(cytidine 5'-diphospho)-2-C-methyl-D-erythritol kinase [Endomicrobium sp.]|jgi:4-diphosphocytidyl-2-C-methyl-D-erythritol kinase|nr:4-(cytidine 5'-diphospho)-2-C-methyl-D-erythritol kinase [Endomicrobium sp.]
MKLYSRAPAKINFFLEIKNKRADGYHNIKSIMQTIGLYDELYFELTDSEISLKCENCNLSNNKKNIIYKTIQAVKKYYNISNGVKVYLKKRIPIKAGLGGGSSDAASTLKSLIKLWKIKTSKNEIKKIAIKLGADVPFFLTAGTALCEGIGEIITPLKSIGKLNVVLVNPGFGLSSNNVYKKIKFPLKNQIKINNIFKSFICNHFFVKKEMLNYCFNRFEEFIFPNYQEISKIKKTLSKLCDVSLMSGSGTTVFGIYSDKTIKTENLKSKLNNHNNWKIWFVKTIDR